MKRLASLRRRSTHPNPFCVYPRGYSSKHTASSLPVTLLTGFLGSGKTTLLNHLLGSNHGLRLAVIQNEFGATSIDDSLLAHHSLVEDDIIYTSNGCLCCTARSDLEPALAKLHRAHLMERLDGIVVETTGLAKPSTIAQTILLPPQSDFCTLDSVLTMVDTKHLPQQLELIGGEAHAQVLFADKLILNKCDLVSDKDLEQLQRQLAALNPVASMTKTSFGRVETGEILGLESFELDKVAESVDGLGEGHHHHHHHHHQVGATSVSIHEPGASLDLEKVQQWIIGLVQTQGESVWRVKGVLSVREQDQLVDRKLVIQAVHSMVNGDWVGEWADEERSSRLVFIGPGLDEDSLRQSFQDCLV